jgi:nucleotide-binding universal stress UspA family protein
MFEKILVPTDGSDQADKAVEVASDLAVKYGAALTVLHVMEDIGRSRIPPELESLNKIEHAEITEHDMLRSVAKRIVDRAASRARELGVTKIDRDVLVGNPAREIVDYAQRSKVDLIVIGRRGLGRVADLLLGSVSHRVTQLAECPCLAVK